MWVACIPAENSSMIYDTDIVMECLKQQIAFDQNDGNAIQYNHIGDGSCFEQVTGQTKNGKEIYRCDIVCVKGTKRKGVYNAVVEWRDLGFVINPNLTYLNDSKSLMAVIAVVGNIHENPELLKP